MKKLYAWCLDFWDRLVAKLKIFSHNDEEKASSITLIIRSILRFTVHEDNSQVCFHYLRMHQIKNVFSMGLILLFISFY